MKTVHQKKQRPWGHYIKFFQESGVWVKRVEVNKGERISLQKHDHRSEKWVIVSGEGLVTINKVTTYVSNGSVIDIPLHCRHRIANIGKKPLVFIEVACGDRLTENDIERFDDDYKRVK